MTPDDRRLFEALCVAAVPAMGETGRPILLDRQDCARLTGNALSILEALRMTEATPGMWKTLSAIRAAEGEDEPTPTQSVRTVGGGAGTARDLTAEDTIRALTEKLTEKEGKVKALRAEVEILRGRVSPFLSKVGDVLEWQDHETILDAASRAASDLDHAADIIYSLCMERAMHRHCRRVDAARAQMLADDTRGPKPSRRVLPVGTVLTGDLQVGMLVQVKGFDPCRITHIEKGCTWAGRECITMHPRGIHGTPITLLEPFEVPND